jgi:hypothetical protein
MRTTLSSPVPFPEDTMATRTVSINRAPVLTLWATVVAERLGFDHDEALTLGRAVAGLNAQAKGRRLGVFKPHEEKATTARQKNHDERFLVEVCGRDVPAVNTPDGVRAGSGGRPVDADGVEAYLENQFGDGGKESLLTLCFDRTTGMELWRHDFGLGVDQRTHEKSNLAVNTPAVTKDAVYVAFGNADIARYRRPRRSPGTG